MEWQAHAREVETRKRRASEADLQDPSGAEQKMVKRIQQSKGKIQKFGSIESLDMMFDLSCNAKANLVVWLADYAAGMTTEVSSSFDASTGLTVTGYMQDLDGYVRGHPTQVAGYNFANSNEQESNRPAAIRLSWSAKSRPSQKVPEWFDIDLWQNAIRQDCKASRVAARDPVLVLLPMFKPIATVTSMSEVEILNAFLALIYGHAILWSIGVEHGDITEGNLMFDDKNKKPKLCDFDLAHIRGRDHPSGYSNTGTWAFMAMKLLTIGAMNGEVARLYRHDFESFIAVLIWVVFRYRDGKLVPDPPLRLVEWAQLNRYICCAANRKHTFDHISKKLLAGPTSLSPAMWGAIVEAVTHLQVYIPTCEVLAIKISRMEEEEEEARNRGPDEGDPLTVNKRRKPAPERPSLAKLKEELMGYDGLTFLDKVLGMELFSFPGSKGTFFTDLLDTHIDDLKKSTVS
ncbi:hypothetical protein D9611_000692 [Ephemerocybe angulata]|uniref:Fungal-type protein kinase domain-containing protein n=1 Tax=Ephemerocybe angulata TaxID=980116 RepID=A0A8H5BMN1_9AGAR|nr:hypothetical protein D9611_000692 [Tulosesus angulatus]